MTSSTDNANSFAVRELVFEHLNHRVSEGSSSASQLPSPSFSTSTECNLPLGRRGSSCASLSGSRCPSLSIATLAHTSQHLNEGLSPEDADLLYPPPPPRCDCSTTSTALPPSNSLQHSEDDDDEEDDLLVPQFPPSSVVLIRHGQSEVNEVGSGRLVFDPPLIETSHTALQCLVEPLECFEPTQVFTSPLQRALQTAEFLFSTFVNESSGDVVPVTVIPAAREIIKRDQPAEHHRPLRLVQRQFPYADFSEVFGRPTATITSSSATGDGEDDWSIDESGAEFRARAKRLLRRVHRSISREGHKRVAVVSHYHVICALLDAAVGEQQSNPALDRALAASKKYLLSTAHAVRLEFTADGQVKLFPFR